MNERIIELIENQNGHRGVLWTEEDKEEFAELIVRECAGVVQNAVDHREPASTYVDKIKQHFGVEVQS